MGFDAVDRQFKRSEPIKLECLGCGTTEGVEMRSSMTAYHWDGTGEDPNRPWPGCERCGEDYFRDMQAQWDEWRAGLL